MIKLRTISLKNYNRLLRIILAVLGFSTACEDTVRYYGMPSATYVVKGNVKSEITGGNIPGIMVKLRYDSAFTDASGNYIVTDNTLYWDTVPVTFRDVDSVVNREYRDLDTFTFFDDVKFTGGDGEWYNGKGEKVLNVKLPDKE